MDIAGTVLSAEETEAGLITLKLRDTADRVVKVHRLDRRDQGISDLRAGDAVWFFNLASLEPRAVASGWRHPRNFYEIPASASERRAWRFRPFLS